MEAKELFHEAQILLMQGKQKESIEILTKAIEAGADKAMAYLSRGVAYLQLKETDKAIEDFGAAAEADKSNARPYYYRGTAYMIKEDYKKAIEDLSISLRLKPGNGAAMFARGTAFVQLGMEDEASKDIKSALAVSETAVQSFVDTYGILRTQFDRALMMMSGEGKAPGLALTEEEQAKLRKWIEE
jgi:tetratricopeptide (TPR) repeat protein